MRAALIVFAVLAGPALAANHGQKVSPIEKVIEMLTDMLAKGKQEKQEETVRFASFKQFCESTTAEKQKAIAGGKDAIEQLEAAIAKAGADAAVATKEIAGLDGDVATWTADLKRTRAKREKEHAAFEEAHKEYVDSIDAVGRALGMLEKGGGGKSIPQSMLQMALHPENMFSLLQVPKGSLTPHAHRQMLSFIQKLSPEKALLQEAEDEGIMVDQPTAASMTKAYEGSSGGIIELVERLGAKFTEEKQELEKREANAANAFAQMTADLEAQVFAAGEERGMKEKTKATRLEDKAEAKGDLADTSAALAEDEKFLADMTTECETKSFDYQQRQIVRQGEIDAIMKAIEIMKSPDVSGLVQVPKALVQRRTSFAQLRSSTRSPALDAVVAFLQDKANQTNSRLLALIASRAAIDPFKKVKKMCQDMITKLMEEANEEASHKAFCDTEMSTNKQTRDKKTEDSEMLQADIEELMSTISKLASEITELGNQITEIDAGIAKATSERSDEKAKNQATIEDATRGEQAVGQAIAVLKEFYDKAATPVEQPAPQQGPISWDNRALQILENGKGAASLLQTDAKTTVEATKGRVPGAPEMEEGAYTGMGNGGVLGLMEVCQSDFAKIVAETSSSESEAAKDYDQFMYDSKEDKAVKTTDQKHKMSSKQEKSSNLATAQKDLRITMEELNAAMAYYDKLKPDCEEKVMSYEEKVAAREAEITALKEALDILSGENI